MRVQFATEGGVAYTPGMSRPVTIGSEDLAAQEVGELERLLEDARFFELPARANEAAARSRLSSIRDNGPGGWTGAYSAVNRPHRGSRPPFVGFLSQS